MTFVPAVLVLGQAITFANAHLVAIDLRDPLHAVWTVLARLVWEPIFAVLLVPAWMLVGIVLFLLAIPVFLLYALFILGGGNLSAIDVAQIAAFVRTAHVVAVSHAATRI